MIPVTEGFHGPKRGLEYADRTWNPVRGCSRVSDACKHCYAEPIGGMMSGDGQAYHGLVKLYGKEWRWTGQVNEVPAALAQPLSWRQPQRIFVGAMSDLFHDQVTDEFLHRVFAVMRQARWHTFLLCTKRSRRMARYLAEHGCPPNVWPGTTIENERVADHRLQDMVTIGVETGARVRWISMEPLLEPVNLLAWPQAFDWIAVGGETGPGARPFKPEWAGAVIDQGMALGVPVYVKQMGTAWALVRTWMQGDTTGNDPRFWPEGLNVRLIPDPAPVGSGQAELFA